MDVVQRRHPTRKSSPVEDHQHHAFRSYGTDLKTSFESVPKPVKTWPVFVLRLMKL